jgi:Phosphate-induced protein 1 conserved region/Ricin-type beta-trefoil lectin domain
MISNFWKGCFSMAIGRQSGVWTVTLALIPLRIFAQVAPQGQNSTPPIFIMRTPEQQAMHRAAMSRAQAAMGPVETSPGSNGIGYHGGPVMLGTVNIYLIWYGNWPGDTAPDIITNFARNISGSRYFNINTGYYDRNNTRISNSVQYKASSYDNYSHGVNLEQNDIGSIVASQIDTGALGPADPNGVYFVLTSQDVTMPGFKSAYCSWHSYASNIFDGNVSGDLKFAFIGDAPEACSVQPISPNDNAGADGMASTFAHELDESITDPVGTAWYDYVDNSYSENADKCAWNMGPTQTAPNGSQYNVILGSRRYLIQQNWVNDRGGYCGQSWGPLLTGWNSLVSKHSGLCLDLPTWQGSNWGRDSGTALQQYTCTASPSQRFSFTPVPNGYKITIMRSGQQLDVRGGAPATEDGTPIIQYPYWGGSNEVWKVSNPDPEGYVTIHPLNSGKCMDVSRISTQPTALVWEWTCWGGDNQKWKLVPMK